MAQVVTNIPPILRELEEKGIEMSHMIDSAMELYVPYEEVDGDKGIDEIKIGQ